MKSNFRLRHYNYPSNMDEDCVDICDVFNSVGLITEHSCCGHGDSSFIVIFNKSVSTEKIDEFLMLFTNKYNHSPFLGKFLMWSRKMSGKIVHNWMYEAPSTKFANIDMATICQELKLNDNEGGFE